MTWGLTHEAGGVGRVGAHLAVHLDEALLHDLEHLIAGERVLEPVAQEDDERQALAQPVRARAGPRRVHAAELVQHPCLGRRQTLQVLLGTASLHTTPHDHPLYTQSLKLRYCIYKIVSVLLRMIYSVRKEE